MSQKLQNICLIGKKREYSYRENTRKEKIREVYFQEKNIFENILLTVGKIKEKR